MTLVLISRVDMGTGEEGRVLLGESDLFLNFIRERESTGLAGSGSLRMTKRCRELNG